MKTYKVTGCGMHGSTIRWTQDINIATKLLIKGRHEMKMVDADTNTLIGRRWKDDENKWQWMVDL
jgi:hypothetical protein